MDKSREEHKSYIRVPLTLYVDKIEFEPTEYVGEVIRTAYDLELTEHDMKKLHDELGKRLEHKIIVPTRIRVIGRLVS